MGRPVEFLSDEYKQIVRTAVSLFESDSDTISLKGSNIKRFNSRLEVICDEFPLDPTELSISQDSYTQAMRKFLFTLREEVNPGETFESKYQTLIDELAGRSIKEFRIGMPWSLRFRRGSGPDSFEILGETFHRLSPREWTSQFVSLAQGSEGYENIVEASVNDPTDRRTYTFWRHDIRARDPQYAIDRVEELVEVLFGKLLFFSRFREGYPMRFGPGSIWARGWADLKNPFIYIVIEDGSYLRTYFDEDVAERNRERVDAKRLERFLDAFPQLRTGEPILSDMIGALRSLQSAMTTPDKKKSFLDLWRALDICTLAGRDLAVKDVLGRGAATIEFNLPRPVLEHRLHKMEDKRNSLVHQDIGTEVEERDIEFMHALVEGSLHFLWAHLTDYSREDIIYFLKSAQKSDTELRRRLKQIEREKELLNDLLEEE